MNNILPIRLKLGIINCIEQIVHNLHMGKDLTPYIEMMKRNALLLDEEIQRDVLRFVEIVQFQAVYDPFHRLTQEVQNTADRLIEDLGFVPPKNEE